VAAHPVALALDVDDGGVVQESVQDRRRYDLVGEDRSPFIWGWDMFVVEDSGWCLESFFSGVLFDL
jgi:hypothetical protein